MPGQNESERKPLSVSAAVNIAKSIISQHSFHIVGEVSELNQKPGYKAVYFTIKDENASLPCLMWVNRYKNSGVALRLGARVEVVGKFSIFAPKGRMNFDVSTLRLAGEGDLRAQIAQLALKLRNEGLMDQARKRPALLYPQKIGLVTSPRGAAVHDVLRTLRRRYPAACVLLAGVPVEGKDAAQNLINGLRCVIDAGAEEVLLVRGGGSFEDLIPFNDEALARYIAQCPVPVITGIGHEHDNSIADMVADIRASTPTGAAEAASIGIAEIQEIMASSESRMSSVFIHRLNTSMNFLNNIESRPLFRDSNALFANNNQLLDFYQSKLLNKMQSCGKESKSMLEQLKLRLQGALPHNLSGQNNKLNQAQIRLRAAIPYNLELCSKQLESIQLRLATLLPQTISTKNAGVIEAQNRLNSSMDIILASKQQSLSLQKYAFSKAGMNLLDPYKTIASLTVSRLNDLSPLRTLERGWSIAKNNKGKVVSSISQVEENDYLAIQVTDGVLDCRVESKSVSQLLTNDEEPTETKAQ